MRSSVPTNTLAVYSLPLSLPRMELSGKVETEPDAPLDVLREVALKYEAELREKIAQSQKDEPEPVQRPTSRCALLV